MERRSWIVVTASVMFMAGCGPHWHVLSQASPDPFLNQNRFAVTAVDFTGLHVGDKTEGQYLSEKDGDAQTSFQGDKVGINEEFTQGLMDAGHEFDLNVVRATGPESAPFLIVPH